MILGCHYFWKHPNQIFLCKLFQLDLQNPHMDVTGLLQQRSRLEREARCQVETLQKDQIKALGTWTFLRLFNGRRTAMTIDNQPFVDLSRIYIWNGDVPFVILVFAGVSKKVRQWEPPIWRAKSFCKQGAGPHSLHCIFQCKSLGTVTWNNRKCNLPKRQRKGAGRSWGVAEWDHFGLSIQGALDDK